MGTAVGGREIVTGMVVRRLADVHRRLAEGRGFLEIAGGFGLPRYALALEFRPHQRREGGVPR